MRDRVYLCKKQNKKSFGQAFTKAFWASSPKRVLRTMKRGEDGAAVKVSVPLQGTKKLWEPQEDREEILRDL